jgi:alpha-1,3-rhamnosyl/mannosyltransferase
MRVVVNELGSLGRRTGVGLYTTELLRCLRQQALPGNIQAFPQGWLRRLKDACARAQAGDRPRAAPDAPAAATAPLRRRLMEPLRQWGRNATLWSFRHYCARHAIQVYHEPNHLPLPIELPTVVTIHDLSALLHPEWHPRDRVVRFAKQFHDGLRRCRHFLAVSEFTRQEIIRHLGVSPTSVTRIYNGVRRHLKPLPPETVAPVLRRLRLPPCYLLYVGTLEPRKNLLTLLEAYCGLPLGLRERYPLVLAGSWGWKAEAVADHLQREGRARGILHLGYVPDEHLVTLYNGARALVYPSFYEGFGLPPVEMLACGGAVLASTAGALVETVGKQAHLIAPEDIDGWRAGMARVLGDDAWWQSLRRGAVEAARPYSWERCAAETLRVYRSLCGMTEAGAYRVAG